MEVSTSKNGSVRCGGSNSASQVQNVSCSDSDDQARSTRKSKETCRQKKESEEKLLQVTAGNEREKRLRDYDKTDTSGRDMRILWWEWRGSCLLFHPLISWAGGPGTET